MRWQVKLLDKLGVETGGYCSVEPAQGFEVCDKTRVCTAFCPEKLKLWGHVHCRNHDCSADCKLRDHDRAAKLLSPLGTETL